MSDFLRTHSAAISTFEFLGLIVLISILEIIAPRKPRSGATRLRWFGNIGSMVLGTVSVRLLFPVIGFGFAILCAQRGWGLLNQAAMPGWLKGVVTVVVLDFAVYIRHWLGHHVSFMWRLHRLHHTDDDVDFTTALRFHPLDSVLNAAIELGLVAGLGAVPMVLLVFNLLTDILDFMIHANFRFPAGLDGFIRWVIVTPDMHRIHHSQRMRETNSNFGSVCSLWDRLFRTYVAEPIGGHEQMPSGLTEFSHPKHQTLPWMLAQPFLRVNSGTYEDE
jgi:sterol desaturase/sphingolipid hydroxylase (fatty acid hydroxylase superfamily)